MRDLDQIPGAPGLPLLGHTLRWLREPIATPVSMYEAFGDVFRYPIFFDHPIVFAHPDALGEIFGDEGSDLSTAAGWYPFFGPMLPGGLLLRDHQDHHHHRGLMQAAFTSAALRSYVEVMTPRIAAIVDAWRARERLLAYPSFKALTLDLASLVFLGVDPGDQLTRLARAFEDVTRGVTALVPVPLPGTALRRAQQGRALLGQYLRRLIAERRLTAETPNLLSQLCHASDELGNRFTDEEIINHMIFVWLAAHDTTTGSLVMLAYELARHPEWQERLRSEASALNRELRFEKLGEARESECVISEVLRLYPPVASLPRRTLRPCVIGGVRLPADTPLRASVLLAQRHPAFWTRPHAFEPQRFAPERAEHRRHKHSFRPFGGGAHMCLGMRFAMLQIKSVLHQVLLRYKLVLPPGYQQKLRPTPSFRPADDLPLQIVPLAPSGVAATRSRA